MSTMDKVIIVAGIACQVIGYTMLRACVLG